MNRSILYTPLFLLSCVPIDIENKVHEYNVPPSLYFEEPIDESSYPEYEEVLFVAFVEDNRDSQEDIRLEWSSDLQGTLYGTEHPDADGWVFFPTSSLVPGNHTILLTAFDSADLSTTISISINIIDSPEAPTVELLSPEEDEIGRTDADSFFELYIEDTFDGIENLNIEFNSDHPAFTGSFCTPEFSEENTAFCSVLMPEGEHLLSFVVTNSADYKYIGANASYTIHYEIQKGPLSPPQEVILKAPMSPVLAEVNEFVTTVTTSA